MAELGVTNVELRPVFGRDSATSLRVGVMDNHPNEFAHWLAAAPLIEPVTSPLQAPVAAAR